MFLARSSAPVVLLVGFPPILFLQSPDFSHSQPCVPNIIIQQTIPYAQCPTLTTTPTIIFRMCHYAGSDGIQLNIAAARYQVFISSYETTNYEQFASKLGFSTGSLGSLSVNVFSVANFYDVNQ
jgi:hypothetical protein